MMLSRRERMIAIATGVTLVLAGLYQFVVQPLLEARAQTQAAVVEAQLRLDRAQRLFSTSRRMNRRWGEMTGARLARNASEAESQLLNAVREWEQDSGLTLASFRPERSGEKEKDFMKMTFRATGTGSMSQVARFLYRIHTAPIPVRITDLTINPRREATDELAVSLGISTIYLPGDSPRPAPPPTGAGTAAQASSEGRWLP
jgi:multidrug efflux pump subunit AcrA (membrane-fusion protein)